jgi:hypothetical protein
MVPSTLPGFALAAACHEQQGICSRPACSRLACCAVSGCWSVGRVCYCACQLSMIALLAAAWLCDVCWCFDCWGWPSGRWVTYQNELRYCTKYRNCFSDCNVAGFLPIFNSYPPGTCILYVWQRVLVNFSFHVSPLGRGIYGSLMETIQDADLSVLKYYRKF